MMVMIQDVLVLVFVALAYTFGCSFCRSSGCVEF